MIVSEVIKDILYPPRCPLCEKILPGIPGKRRRLACRECIRKLKPVVSPRCMKCGKQLDRMEQEYCGDCRKKRHLFDRGAGAVSYSDAMRLSMHRFKYKCRREYAPFYAWLIREQCGRLIEQWDIDVIVPVPMHRRKQRMRGYNQAELIAAELGRLFGIEVNSEILVRAKNTRPMKELNHMERTKNLQNAFKINRSMLEYNHILLVDDIYTTGTTADECARALKNAGAGRVYCVCLCIGNGF